MKKLLWISEYNNTGFGNVSQILIKYIIKKYDIYIFVVNNKNGMNNCEIDTKKKNIIN
jgi:hypothetical protein